MSEESFVRHHQTIGLLPAVLALMLGLLPTVTDLPRVQAAEVALEKVGILPLEDTDSAVSDEVGRRLLVWRLKAPTSEFLLFDPVATKELGRRDLPYALSQNVYAFDQVGRRLWILGYTSLADRTAQANPLLVALTAEGVVLAATPLAGFPPTTSIVGMSWSAADNRLYLVAQVEEPIKLAGTYAMFVHALNPETGAPAWPSGPQLVESCQRAVAETRQAAVMRNPLNRRLYIGCGVGNLALTPQPGLPAIAEIDIDDPAHLKTVLHPVAGGYAAGESFFDEVAGKFVMVSAGAAQPVQAAWVFDALHNVVTGVVSAGKLNVHKSALDPVTGSVFVGIDGYLLVGSDRLRKTPQAVALPLSGMGGGGVYGIVPMAFAGMVVVPVLEGGTAKAVLYRISVPAVAEPPDDDFDAYTIDAPEAPGKVEAAFAGDAQAYGVRVHEVAGVNGAAQNGVPANHDWWVFLNDNFKNGTAWIPSDARAATGNKALPNDGSRDLYLSRVVKAHMSQVEASAAAIEGDRDSTTEADWTQATGTKWPYEAASCADFGKGDAAQAKGTATVSCDAARLSISASAAHQGLTATGPSVTIGVGSSSASTMLRRPKDAPLKVVSRAEARSIDIAGVVHIGRVASEAVTEVAGRPGTARASYTRTFENVSMPGYTCTADCDEAAIAQQMNRVLGVKFRVELPDGSLAATPRGAHADASRDPWQHQEDVVLNDQADSELQIPALRVTYLNDNAHRSRVLFEFAATDATADFRLFSLGGESGGVEDAFAGSAFGNGEGASLDVGLPPAGSVHALDVDSVDATGVAAGPRGILRRLARGLRLALLGRDHTVLNALLWLLLAVPAFLSARRRHLLRLTGVLR